MSSSRTAGIAVLVFAALSLTWTVLEVFPPALGYEDTDNPAVMVQFIRDYPQVYRAAGVVLIITAFTLTVAVLAVWDRLNEAATGPRLTLRTAAVFGLFAAAMFLPLGGLRLASGSTLLLVDELNEEWSESAYLAFQMVGTQSLGAAAVICACVWAVGLSIHGIRSSALPTWLCVLAAIPALRIAVGLLAPFSIDSSAAWIAYMLAIPGTALWFALLGVVLLRNKSAATSPSPAASALPQ